MDNQTPNSNSNPLPSSGFCFALPEVALACRAWGPQLALFVPAPLDPVQLMWAFANKESLHDREGFLGCEPRFEPAYYTGGRYASQPPMPALIEAYGKDAAKSYGPWQVMLCNAAKWRPEDFKYLDICAESFVTYLSNRCRIHRPANLDEFGQLYNGGHIVAKPDLPNAQVLEYCHHLAQWYLKPIPGGAMNKIKAWLVAHNVSSHSIAAGAIFAGSLYVTNDQVKAMVDAFLASHKNLSAVFTVLLAAYLKYSHGHNPNN